MKICLFGGTFDPIHKGHIHIAKNALSEFELDKVIFVPTGNSYMKKDVSPAIHRLNMLKIALKNYPEFEISDIEIKREGYTYTRDTIKEIKEIYPDAEIYFLIGTDTLFMIEKWVEPEYLFNNLIFIVADRKDDNSKEKAEELKDKFNADIRFSNCDFYDISSSDIRSKIRELGYSEFAFEMKKASETKETNYEGSFSFRFVIESVFEYIKDNHLYIDLNDVEMITLLSKDLKESRLIHTLGVMDEASVLAKVYNADIKKVTLAALLHDCAKYMPMDESIEICERNFVKLNDLERKKSSLLHSKAGACLAYEKYGIKDKEILDAISYHTTGRPDMSILEKPIFISDAIEPNRDYSEKLPMYRMIANVDIDLVCMNILKDTLDHLNSTEEKQEMDSKTIETYEYYKALISSRENKN